MEPEVAASLSLMPAIGETTTQRLDNPLIPVSDTIPRQNIFTFASQPDLKKKTQNVGVQRQNMTLVTQLFLSLQSRPDADMRDFFCYENQREPPSLADHGTRRTGFKSHVIDCISAPTGHTIPSNQVTVVLLDMAAVVHMIRPTNAQTFSEYVAKHIIPYIKSHITPMISRIDAIWDCYPCDSLKTLAHKRRECGPRTKVGDGSTHIPKRDWNSGFLKNEENEKELFPFISEMIANDDMDGRLLLTTKQESVLSNKPCDMSSVQPCNHSEADTRIFLHLAHAVHQGHKVAYVRTVDSDVVVLAVRFFQNTWPGAVLGRLWFWKIIQRHSHPQHLCSTQAIEVTGFAPISRSHRLWYNITFPGMWKEDCLASLDVLPRPHRNPHRPHTRPNSADTSIYPYSTTWSLCGLMYNRSYSAARVNNARVHLLTRGMCSLEKLPPTQAALFEHAKRALIQASYHWDKATTPVHALPDFNSWGWFKSDQGVWCPYWTSLPDANKACAILLRCGCLKSCIGNCKCSKAGVRCTSLCKCEAGCINNTDDLWYHLLCSVHYGLYVNRIYMQCDKNCMNQIYMTIIAWIHVLFSPY